MEDNYTLTGMTVVYDSYDAYSSATDTTRVLPVKYTTAQLANISAALTTEALESGDPEASMQILGATHTSLSGGSADRRRLLASSETAELRTSLLATLKETYAMSEITEANFDSMMSTLDGIVNAPNDLTTATAVDSLLFATRLLSASLEEEIGISTTGTGYTGSALSYLLLSSMFNTSDVTSATSVSANNITDAIRYVSIAQLDGAYAGVSFTVSSPLIHSTSAREEAEDLSGGSKGVPGSNAKVSFPRLMPAKLNVSAATYVDTRVVTIAADIYTAFDSYGKRVITKMYGDSEYNSDLNSDIIQVEVMDEDGNVFDVGGLHPAEPIVLTLQATEPIDTNFSAWQKHAVCDNGVGELVFDCALGAQTYTCDASKGGDGGTYFLDFTCPGVVPACMWWSEADGEWAHEGCSVVNYTSTNVTCACSHLGDFVLGKNISDPRTEIAFTSSPSSTPTSFPSSFPTQLPIPSPSRLPSAQPTTPSPSVIPSAKPTVTSTELTATPTALNQSDGESDDAGGVDSSTASKSYLGYGNLEIGVAILVVFFGCCQCAGWYAVFKFYRKATKAIARSSAPIAPTSPAAPPSLRPTVINESAAGASAAEHLMPETPSEPGHGSDTIREWLDTKVKNGYGGRFGPAFQACGIEDGSDLTNMNAELMEELTALLKAAGAKTMHLSNITNGIDELKEPVLRPRTPSAPPRPRTPSAPPPDAADMAELGMGSPLPGLSLARIGQDELLKANVVAMDSGLNNIPITPSILSQASKGVDGDGTNLPLHQSARYSVLDLPNEMISDVSHRQPQPLQQAIETKVLPHSYPAAPACPQPSVPMELSPTPTQRAQRPLQQQPTAMDGELEGEAQSASELLNRLQHMEQEAKVHLQSQMGSETVSKRSQTSGATPSTPYTIITRSSPTLRSPANSLTHSFLTLPVAYTIILPN